MRRIFIAINLDDNAKRKLSIIRDSFPDLPCRWLEPDTFHLTLTFLGQIGDKDLEKIAEAIKEAASRHNLFEIVLDKVVYGPPKIFPSRLIWIEGKPLLELEDLKKDLDAGLNKAINFQPENKKLIPHITLARINQFAWRRFNPEERPKVNLDFPLKIPVSSIEIMESQLKRDSAEYTIIKSFSLVVAS